MTLREVGNLRRALREENAGGSHTRAEWMAQLESQGFMCFWCGKKLRVNGKLRATRDHLTPLSKGGADSIENIVGACQPCNSSKGSRTGEEFREHLAKTGKRVPAFCTVPVIRKEVVFSRDITPGIRKFTDPIEADKKFPARPDHYWTERRDFLKWQLRSLIKGEAGTLAFKGIEVKRA